VAHPRILIAGGGLRCYEDARRECPARVVRGSSVREHHEWLYSHDATAAPL
jgi:hypothetical protein